MIKALRDAERAGLINGSTEDMRAQVQAAMRGEPIPKPTCTPDHAPEEVSGPKPGSKAVKVLQYWNCGHLEKGIARELRIQVHSVRSTVSKWRARGVRLLDRAERARARRMIEAGEDYQDFTKVFDV